MVETPISTQNTSRVAQSFYVDRDRGIFVTSIDIYFSEKSDTTDLPVYLTLRPMESGRPSPYTYLAKAEKNWSDINVDSTGQTPTNFKFSHPVYLDAFRFYAFAVETNTSLYKIHYSEIYQHILGSTEKLVDKNPVTGSVFYSQNGVTWSEVQEQDLKFRVKKATWVNHPSITANELINIKLQNKAVPNRILASNPIKTDGTTTFYVKHPNHGFLEGDTVNISGVVGLGGTNYIGGIHKDNINGVRTIKSGSGNVAARDWKGYYIVAGTGAANTTLTGETGGGDGVEVEQNYIYTHFVPNLDTANVNGTQVFAGVKGFSAQKNIFNSESGAYDRDATYAQVKLNKTNRWRDVPRVIGNSSVEAAHTTGASINDNKSFEIGLYLSTDDARDVMPFIDMQRANVALMYPAIDNPSLTVNSTNGQNMVAYPVAETSPSGGTILAKHITSIFPVEEPAVGIKLLIGANRPNVASFDVYYRVGTSDENIREKSWVYIAPDNSPPSDENPGIYRDYEYTIGGDNGLTQEFEQFQFKITMNTSNMLYYPTLRDLRAIVLLD